MGLCTTGDEWCIRSDAVVEGLNLASKIVDDILIQGPTWPETMARAEVVLQRCTENNMSISLKKFICGEEVHFAGKIIHGQGVKPDPKLVEGIQKFPRPDNLTKLRSFLGLAQQFAHFVPDLSKASRDMLALLKKKAEYVWTETHKNSFEMVKGLLTSPLCVQCFNPTHETALIKDASRLHGLGFVLVQKKPGTKTHVSSKVAAEASQTVKHATPRWSYRCSGSSLPLRNATSTSEDSNTSPFTQTTSHSLDS